MPIYNGVLETSWHKFNIKPLNHLKLSDFSRFPNYDSTDAQEDYPDSTF